MSFFDDHSQDGFDREVSFSEVKVKLGIGSKVDAKWLYAYGCPAFSLSATSVLSVD